jgi:hypothetical protein
MRYIKTFEQVKEKKLKEKIKSIIDFIPDSDIPSETNIIKEIGDVLIYTEGWCDRCFSNYDLDSREEKVNWAKEKTFMLLKKQPYLPQNKLLHGKKLIDWEFIELFDNSINYCLSVGIYK